MRWRRWKNKKDVDTYLLFGYRWCMHWKKIKSHPQYEIAKKQMKQGGGIVTVVLKNGVEGASKFMDGLKMFSISANLADTRSIATHPATSTHSKLTEEQRLEVGIEQGTVRLSIGLEHIDDILADIQLALS